MARALRALVAEADLVLRLVEEGLVVVAVVAAVARDGVTRLLGVRLLVLYIGSGPCPMYE